MKNEGEHQTYKNFYFGSKVISVGFFLMYGIVPFLLNNSGVYNVHWANKSLAFSLFGALVVASFPSPKFRMSIRSVTSEREVGKKNLLIYFLLAIVLFYFFPWHDSREGIGSKFSALLRAVWFVVIVKSINRSERFRTILFIVSLFLMALDESRTYFTVLLAALAFRSKHIAIYLSASVLGIVLVAAVRMGVTGSPLTVLLYGIIGEAYNATRPVGQILLISNYEIDWHLHLLQTYFQPLIFPFEFLSSKLNIIDFPAQSSYFSTLVDSALNEELSPMGGWYIVADFIYYGFLGFPLLALYLYVAWFLTNYLLNTRKFPIGAYVFMICIKATPYVYWKLVFYLFLISILVGLVERTVLRKNRTQ